MNNNLWNILESISSSIGALAAIVFSTFIYRQTKALSSKQLELQKYQLDLQRQQIRIDTFPYKRGIYLNLLKVIEFSYHTLGIINQHTTQELLNNEKNGSDEFWTPLSIYNFTRGIYLGWDKEDDKNNIISILAEAKYILPSDISSCILNINESFNLSAKKSPTS